jgi:CHAT domain-containing protein
VPFAVLQVAAPGGAHKAEPLLRTHDLVYLPSAELATRRLLPRLGDHAEDRLLLIADPVFDRDDPRTQVPANAKDRGLALFRRLPATSDEAVAVESHWPNGTVDENVGPEATKEAIAARKLVNYRVIHIAAHGVAVTDRPEMSRLLLSRFDQSGHPHSSALLEFEVSRAMHLSADLVILSACDTQVGANLRGEGMLGLSRAFLRARAARVMSSLWEVGTESVNLMDSVHGHLRSGCFDPVAAANAGQREIAESLQWTHPAQWAAFVLEGDWRGCATRNATPAKRLEPTK